MPLHCRRVHAGLAASLEMEDWPQLGRGLTGLNTKLELELRTMLRGLVAAACLAEAACFTAPSPVARHAGSPAAAMSASRPEGSPSAALDGRMSRRSLGLAVGWAVAGLPLAVYAEGEAAAIDSKDRVKIPESELIKPRADGCAQGVGGKCDELNEGNPFIKELQERSAKNRLKYQKEELESYWRRNYKDFFDSACTGYDQKCDFRENPDGTWTVGTKDNAIRVREGPPSYKK